MTPLKWSGGSSSKPSLRIKSPSVNKQTEVLRMGSHAEDFSIYIFGLEFRKAGGAGEGQYITDIRDAGDIHDEPLEAQAETGVARAAEAPRSRYHQ